MEVMVWLIGILLRVLDLLLVPVYWLKPRDPRRLPPPRSPLLLRSATDLARSIRDGELTSEEVVTTFIERVKEVNPYLNAVVEDRFQDAVEEARELDRQLAEARRNGSLEELLKDKPLYGVPFTVKESCSLAGLSDAVGSAGRRGSRAARDGDAVSLTRSAGGVALLVSCTPELCLGWETSSLLHGTTNNPYRLDCTPGGSSGGEEFSSEIRLRMPCYGLVVVQTVELVHASVGGRVVLFFSSDQAALLASAASPLSVSSDIAGSIRIPAAFCGLFGHKPTPGVVSVRGHVPALRDARFRRFLALGPAARHAHDLAPLLRVMAGGNGRLLALDEPVDVSKIKVYYMTEASNSIALMPVQQCIKDGVRSAARYLQSECGAQLCEKKFAEFEDSVEMSVSLFFSMKDIPNLLQDPANPKRDKSLIVELLKHLFGGATISLQGLGFALINRTKLFISKSRREFYQRKAEKFRQEIVSTLGSNGVLLYPAHCGQAHRHGLVFARAAGVLYCMPPNVLRLPATAVPLGERAGLPLAVQVIAGPYQDKLCLAVAKQLEIGFGGWRPPS